LGREAYFEKEKKNKQHLRIIGLFRGGGNYLEYEEGVKNHNQFNI
jgi:hypothetical protein